MERPSLFGHPQMHSNIEACLEPKDRLSHRMVSTSIAAATEGFLVDEVVEYVMRGEKFLQGGHLGSTLKTFRLLKLYDSDRFTELILPILMEEAEGGRDVNDTAGEEAIGISSEVRGNAWIRTGYMMDMQKLDPNISLKIAGTEFNQVECYRRGLSYNPRNLIAWKHLADRYLSRADSKPLEIRGETYSSVMQCYIAACMFKEDDYLSWQFLGNVVRTSVEINGEKLSRIDVRAKAAERSSNPDTWASLLWAMDNNPVAIEGEKCDRCMVALKAIVRFKDSKDAFERFKRDLADQLRRANKTTVSVAGGKISATLARGIVDVTGL